MATAGRHRRGSVDPRSRAGLGVFLAACSILLVLTSCKPGTQVQVHGFQDSGGVGRCSIGQSFIGEQADIQNGLVPAVGVTAVTRDLYCPNEDNLAPAWSSISVRVTLKVFRGGTIDDCAVSPPIVSNSARTVNFTAWADCGTASYYTQSLHGAFRSGSGAWYTKQSTTPNAYNSP